MAFVIHELVAARLHWFGWAAQPLTAVYDTADPYAVSWQLHDGTDRWFARDLLAQGLVEPTATGGDVSIVPLGDAVDLTLRRPGRSIVLRHPASDLQTFLDATKALVPIGAERIDWRAEMRILGGAR